jgi:chromosomal replication initiation ATPase DnaA
MGIDMGRVRIRDVIIQECTRTGIPLQTLIGPSRIQRIVQARQYAIWRCRKETDASLKQIGNCFGFRDHTTILHAINKVEAMLPEERMFMPEKNEFPEIEPFVIDISDLKKKEKEIKSPIPKVVFPIHPIYKVA